MKIGFNVYQLRKFSRGIKWCITWMYLTYLSQNMTMNPFLTKKVRLNFIYTTGRFVPEKQSPYQDIS